MATVKCKLRKMRLPSHEWFDGEKDRIYCRGYIDRMTDEPLEECLSCRDHVSHAQIDLDAFNAMRKNICFPQIDLSGGDEYET